MAADSITQGLELGRYACELVNVCSVSDLDYSSLQHVLSWIRSTIDSQAFPSSPLLATLSACLHDAERAVSPSTGHAMKEIWRSFLPADEPQQPILRDVLAKVRALLLVRLPRGESCLMISLYENFLNCPTQICPSWRSRSLRPWR
jgi:hypothetical protein